MREVDKEEIFDKIEIIFANKDFLVINKPANLMVHQTRISKETTLVDWLLKCYPEIRKIGDEPKTRPGIVHRLDKDVSGLMILTKTQRAFEHFKKEFQERKIEKEYLALVYGRPSKEKGLITLPLTRSKRGITIAKKVGIEKIKEAWTEYEILKKFKNFSLLKIKTKTGRTHQIRIHLKSIGHPIVGDKLYKPKIKTYKSIIDLSRVFLHAYYLGFHDLGGNWHEFKIDLPEKLKNFLKNLE